MKENDMREIWRGKAADRWIVGYLIRYAGDYQIWQKDEKCGSTDNYIVDEETLGGCTGHPDKNGKYIFEGDIITDGKLIFVVEWCARRVTFELICLNLDHTASDFTMSYGEEYEIIGNIHDTPELLKGADDDDGHDLRL